MSTISDLFSNAPAQSAANTATQYANIGLGTATGQVKSGYGAASNYLDTASGILGGSRGTATANYAPYTPGANAAWQSYSDLISGDPATVEKTLTSQPGFQTQMDLALQAANRTSAAGGMGNSGNAIMSAMNASRGLEEANINNYASRLLQMAQYGPQIAGATTSSETAIDQALAGIQGTQATNAIGEGTTLGGLTTTAYNTAGTAQANAALAQQQAAANVWNAVMGVAGLGVKAATGGIIPGITPTTKVAGGFSTGVSPG